MTSNVSRKEHSIFTLFAPECLLKVSRHRYVGQPPLPDKQAKDNLCLHGSFRALNRQEVADWTRRVLFVRETTRRRLSLQSAKSRVFTARFNVPSLEQCWRKDITGFYYYHLSGVCGVVWCGMKWSGQIWPGLVWSELVWFGLAWSGLAWSGLVWSGLVLCGLVWSGLVWSSLVLCGLVWSGLV